MTMVLIKQVATGPWKCFFVRTVRKYLEIIGRKKCTDNANQYLLKNNSATMGWLQYCRTKNANYKKWRFGGDSLSTHKTANDQIETQR